MTNSNTIYVIVTKWTDLTGDQQQWAIFQPAMLTDTDFIIVTKWTNQTCPPFIIYFSVIKIIYDSYLMLILISI